MAGDDAEEIYRCPYQDPVDPTQPCTYASKSDTMIAVHERAKHSKKDETKVKNEVKNNTKKAKRFETKAVKFCENESREEFRRKKAEFLSYQERMNIKGEEIADDLYRCYETTL